MIHPTAKRSLAVAQGRAKRPILDPRKLFELSGQILQEIPDRSDRELLSRRIGDYLSSKRRGRLNLPRRLGSSALRLSQLSKYQLRYVAYWVNPSMSLLCGVDRATEQTMHRIAPGMVWTVTGDTPVYASQEVVSRLPGKLVPRSARAAWPSAPDLFEIMEQSRQGRCALRLDKIPLTVNNHLTKRDVSDNIRVASRIVRRQIVGVRINVKVPEKFLGYFRRRHGFLILSTRHNLPSGLVRYLISRWIQWPTSLWLVMPCSFRRFLNRSLRSEFLRSQDTDPEVKPQEGSGRVSSPNPQPVREPFTDCEPRLHIFQEELLKSYIFETLLPRMRAMRNPQSMTKGGSAYRRPGAYQ